MSIKSSLQLLTSFCLLLLSPFFFSAILIDGKINETEWAEAREITKFYEVYPFTLEEPKYDQKVLVLEDEKGIYFGFINYQSTESIRSNKHERDLERPNADRVGVNIDFDGDNISAYSFSLSVSGSKGDGTYKNENESNPDWDADWGSATSIGEDVWYAEMFIPWSIAPMKVQSGDYRTVRLGFYRMVVGAYKVNATIKGNPYTDEFMSTFNEMKFKNSSISKIDFFPYINVTEDRISEEVDTKTGAEIFWKIDSGKQLNIAINPDFGQVESDELVVNFTANETFYSDKRPFFSENHSLFNVKGYEFFYVINTRRIGAAPDYDCSKFAENLQAICSSSKLGTSDIDLAARYTQQGESFDFGVLAASEADQDFSQGRDFFAIRGRKTSTDYSLGYLGTYVERPVLGRDASVHSFDLAYRPNDKTRIATILLNSNIDGDTGNGFRFRLVAAPTKKLSHDIGFFYFDEDLDLGDMGYLVTNNWAILAGQSKYKVNDFQTDSINMSREYEFGYSTQTNASGDRANDGLSLKVTNTFQNTSRIEIESSFRTSGKDFWITRRDEAAPFINMPAGYGARLQYLGPSADFFNYFLEVKRDQGNQFAPTLGLATTYSGKIDFSPSGNLNFSIYHQHNKEDKWLNWLQGNLLGTYDKKQRTTVAGLQWFKNDKHELRIKAQMVAFTARNPIAYLGSFDGNLNATSEISLDPITLSDLAFQIRYRYEILPLAYLYVVYSKGGRIVATDEEDSLSELYQRPWDNPQADNFTIKLRYRF